MSPSDSPKPPRSIALPLSIVASAITIAFSAGITVSTVSELKAQTAAIAARLDAHEKAPGHVEALARLRTLESDNSAHTAVMREMSERLNRIDTNLALVCQATRGAQCAR